MAEITLSADLTYSTSITVTTGSVDELKQVLLELADKGINMLETPPFAE